MQHGYAPPDYVPTMAQLSRFVTGVGGGLLHALSHFMGDRKLDKVMGGYILRWLFYLDVVRGRTMEGSGSASGVFKKTC